VRIAIPDDAAATHVSQQQLAGFLTDRDSMSASRRVGDEWLDRSDTLVLEVPSVLIPEETNLVLNPGHPRMAEVRIISTRAFRFDPRLVVRKA
jgi:RES domain-containing protein